MKKAAVFSGISILSVIVVALSSCQAGQPPRATTAQLSSKPLSTKLSSQPFSQASSQASSPPVATISDNKSTNSATKQLQAAKNANATNTAPKPTQAAVAVNATAEPETTTPTFATSAPVVAPVEAKTVTVPVAVAAPVAIPVSSAASSSAASSSAASSVAPFSASSTPVVAPLLQSSSAQATPAVNPPELRVIGTVEVALGSRLIAARGGDMTQAAAQDSFKIALKALSKSRSELSVDGQITHVPRVLSSILGRETQPSRSIYRLRMQSPTDVQMWNGTYDANKNGEIAFPPDFRIGKSAPFSGSINKSEFTSAKKNSNQKQVIKLVFRSVGLSAGPGSFPPVSVSGQLDYTSDSHMWMVTAPLVFRYDVNGQQHEDTVTGSISSDQKADWYTSGLGQYRFNLRFNANRQSREEDYFEEKRGQNDEGAFFEEDPAVSGLFGAIRYRETLDVLDGRHTVIQSSLSYDLQSTNLSEIQLINFLKVWLLILPESLEPVA